MPLFLCFNKFVDRYFCYISCSKDFNFTTQGERGHFTIGSIHLISICKIQLSFFGKIEE